MTKKLLFIATSIWFLMDAISRIDGTISFFERIGFNKENVFRTMETIKTILNIGTPFIIICFIWFVYRLQKNFENYRGVNSLSNYYRSWEINGKIQDIVFEKGIADEIRYVFDRLKETNWPKQTNETIYKVIDSYYHIGLFKIRSIIEGNKNSS